MKVVVLGGYGFGNLGDEAALSMILKRLRAGMPSIEIKVFSYNPDETIALHKVDTYHLVSTRIFLELLRANVVVIGGAGLVNRSNFFGSRFQNFPLYLCPGAPTLLLGLLSKLLGKRLIFYAVGTTSVPDPFLRILLPVVANKADFISVRDPLSKAVLSELGVRKKINVVLDPAVDLDCVGAERAQELLRHENVNLSKPLIGLSLRYVGDEQLNDNIVRIGSKVVDWVAEEFGAEIVFFPMSKHRCKPVENDLLLAQEVYQAVRRKDCFKVLEKTYSPQEIKGMIGRMRLFLGMRLHSIVFAYSMGIPFIGLIYDEKVGAFLDSVHYAGFAIEGVTFDDLTSLIMSELRNDG